MSLYKQQLADYNSGCNDGLRDSSRDYISLLFISREHFREQFSQSSYPFSRAFSRAVFAIVSQIMSLGTWVTTLQFARIRCDWNIVGTEYATGPAMKAHNADVTQASTLEQFQALPIRDYMASSKVGLTKVWYISEQHLDDCSKQNSSCNDGLIDYARTRAFPLSPRTHTLPAMAYIFLRGAS